LMKKKRREKIGCTATKLEKLRNPRAVAKRRALGKRRRKLEFLSEIQKKDERPLKTLEYIHKLGKRGKKTGNPERCFGTQGR